MAFHNFNSNDGLPSNEVYCAFQDHDGFLWYGTDHGVVKYNGYNFKTFTTADGLTDNTILEIKGDDENQIWFLTLSGGICYFDGKRFAPHPNNDTIKRFFSKELPTAWEVLPDKEIWMGFVNAGIAKISRNKVAFFASTGLPKSNSDSVHVYLLKLNNDKCVYTSSMSDKLDIIHDSGVKSVISFRVSFDFSGTNFNLLTLKNNEILITKEEYLAYIDSAKNLRQYLRHRNNPILKAIQTGDGKIWLLQKNSSSYSIELTNENLNLIDSITFVHSATGLLLDNQGNQWIATLDQGIYMVPNCAKPQNQNLWRTENAGFPKTFMYKQQSKRSLRWASGRKILKNRYSA